MFPTYRCKVQRPPTPHPRKKSWFANVTVFFPPTFSFLKHPSDGINKTSKKFIPVTLNDAGGSIYCIQCSAQVQVPADLQCPICKDILKDAIMMPCCAGTHYSI